MKFAPRQRDLTGEVFERLRVEAFAGMMVGRRFYRCVCTCGTERVVSASKLLNGHTRSCGCIRRRPNLKRRTLADGEGMRNRVLASYKRNARKKGQQWALSDKEAIEFFQGDCFYCGRPPSNLAEHRSHHGAYLHNGIDRRVNSIGYVPGNVVSCCIECNFRKGDANEDDFIAWAFRVADHLRAGRT